MSTFIIFGNSDRPFIRMVKAVTDNLSSMPQPVVIQAGSNLNNFFCVSKDVYIFDTCNTLEFSKHLNKSSMVITHAGYGSLKESLLSNFSPAVFVRSAKFGEHIDDHQSELVTDLPPESGVDIIDDSVGLGSYILKKNYRDTAKFQAMQEYYSDNFLRAFIHKIIKSELN